MIHFEPRFHIGQKVYHATQESDWGIIVNINYNVRERSNKYEVVFGRLNEDNVWCYEDELSENKVF